jgi:hypothetical protein
VLPLDLFAHAALFTYKKTSRHQGTTTKLRQRYDSATTGYQVRQLRQSGGAACRTAVNMNTVDMHVSYVG